MGGGGGGGVAVGCLQKFAMSWSPQIWFWWQKVLSVSSVPSSKGPVHVVQNVGMWWMRHFWQVAKSLLA